ncbi:MAG: hypothetical protein ACOH2T_19025 [Pseudomonas sp.]
MEVTMTGSIELLPLPSTRLLPCDPRENDSWGYTDVDMQAYARANLAAQAGAIERLREHVRWNVEQNGRLLSEGSQLIDRADRLEAALRELVRAGVAMRNSVVETRGIRRMDEHDAAIRKARAAFTGDNP